MLGWLLGHGKDPLAEWWEYVAPSFEIAEERLAALGETVVAWEDDLATEIDLDDAWSETEAAILLVDHYLMSRPRGTRYESLMGRLFEAYEVGVDNFKVAVEAWRAGDVQYALYAWTEAVDAFNAATAEADWLATATRRRR